MEFNDKVILHPSIKGGDTIDGITIREDMLFCGVKEVYAMSTSRESVILDAKNPDVYPVKALLKVPVFKVGDIVLKVAGEDTGSMVQIVDVSENEYTANEFGEDECEYSYKDMNGNIKTHKISLGFQFPPLDRSSNQIYRHDIEPIKGIGYQKGSVVTVIGNGNNQYKAVVGSIRRITDVDYAKGLYKLQFTKSECEGDNPDWNNIWWDKDCLRKSEEEYAIGDAVTIREGLVSGTVYSRVLFAGEMERYRGKRTVIKRVIPLSEYSIYTLECCSTEWSWSSEMFKKPEQKTKSRFKVGDNTAIVPNNNNNNKSSYAVRLQEQESHFSGCHRQQASAIRSRRDIVRVVIKHPRYQTGFGKGQE